MYPFTHNLPKTIQTDTQMPHQNTGTLAKCSALLCIPVFEKSPKTIKNKGQKSWGKEVGYYLHVHII